MLLGASMLPLGGDEEGPVQASVTAAESVTLTMVAMWGAEREAAYI
jgi:hypothetical protein